MVGSEGCCILAIHSAGVPCRGDKHGAGHLLNPVHERSGDTALRIDVHISCRSLVSRNRYRSIPHLFLLVPTRPALRPSFHDSHPRMRHLCLLTVAPHLRAQHWRGHATASEAVSLAACLLSCKRGSPQYRAFGRAACFFKRGHSIGRHAASRP